MSDTAAGTPLDATAVEEDAGPATPELLRMVTDARIQCPVAIATAAMVLGQIGDRDAAAAVVLDWFRAQAPTDFQDPHAAYAIAAVAVTRLAEVAAAVDFRP